MHQNFFLSKHHIHAEVRWSTHRKKYLGLIGFNFGTCTSINWIFGNKNLLQDTPYFMITDWAMITTRNKKIKKSLQSLKVVCYKIIYLYSCNKLTKTRFQIPRQNWFGFFSNISHQRCSDANFVSFLFYYYCTFDLNSSVLFKIKCQMSNFLKWGN